MYTHIMVGTNDLGKARTFYDAIFTAIGGRPGMERNGRALYQHNGGNFAVGAPLDGNPAASGNGVTIGLMATDPAMVDAFHAAGISAGGSDFGAPGPRPESPGNAYAAYLKDPDGNKVCATCQMAAAD